MLRIQKRQYGTQNLRGTNFKIILNPSELQTLQKPDTVCVTKQRTVQHDTFINVKQFTSFTDRQHTTDRQKHLPAHLLAINTETDCMSFSDTDTHCPARSESLGPPAHPPTTKTVTPPLFQQLY